MNASDFILMLIAGFGGRVQGRTLLQKRAYFVAQLSGVPVDLGFDAHYYGPYSAVVDNTVARLKSLGFITEENLGFGVASSGFEVKRYDYRLTQDGERILASVNKQELRQIGSACKKIMDANDPNYYVLSIAAKANFILGKRGQALTKQEVIREAKKFDWEIQSEALDSATQFLEKIGLVHKAAAKAV